MKVRRVTFGGTPGVMNSVDEILPRLWMGSVVSIWDADGLDLVVNLAQLTEVPNVKKYVRWEIDDGALPDLKRLNELVDLVTEHLCEGETVLIHCNAGVNRSGLLTTLVVREMENLTGPEALTLVRSKRPRGPFPNIVCNPAFESYVLSLGRPREVEKSA
jgi:protein-tyrosine phosphatase